MERKWMLTGIAMIAVGIALGAFGAHGLKQVVSDPDKLVSFETGVRYQLTHGLAFLALAALSSKFSEIGIRIFRFLLIGVILFSGSIYGLVLSSIGGDNLLIKFFGPITPIGGLLLIVGWSLLFVQVWKSKR